MVILNLFLLQNYENYTDYAKIKNVGELTTIQNDRFVVIVFNISSV